MVQRAAAAGQGCSGVSPHRRNASNGDGNGGLVSALFSFVILVAMVGEQEIICVGGGSRS